MNDPLLKAPSVTHLSACTTPELSRASAALGKKTVRATAMWEAQLILAVVVVVELLATSVLGTYLAGERIEVCHIYTHI